MVGTETTAIHRTASIYQPVATPHQAFLSPGSEVPLDKKSSFPPGGSRGEVAAAASIQRTAHFRQFLGGCAARVAKLATRWREAPLASPGGKLLSEARLMRGGDRSVYECSWMSGICSGFLHSTGKSKTFKPSPPLISQPCRFRSAVMADSFPPGEAKNSKTISGYHSTSRSVA